MTATILNATGHAVRIGDRVSYAGDTNRTRRRVVSVPSRTVFEVASFARPSRGWARHVRRMKRDQRQ